MVKPEHSRPLSPHAMSEAELAAIRAPYETLIGFVPPRIMARTDLLARVDPELLRLEEQMRLRAMYPACFDVKTSQLMLFGILLALMGDAARLHAIAARRAGASWEELSAVVSLAFLFRGLPAANLGAEIIQKMAADEAAPRRRLDDSLASGRVRRGAPPGGLAMTVPYRADHVGSFLRPAALLEARKDPATRPERLRQLEDQAILECLARQRDLGFEIFTDGELRRSNFMSDFWDAVAGLDHGDAVARMWQVGATGSPHVSAVTGIVTQKLRQLRRLTGHELPFMKQHSPGAIKVTLPSATQFPAIAYKRGISDRAYATPSEFLWDVGKILKSEVQALVDDGVSYVQIDAPRYSYYMDPKWRDWIRTEMGQDPEAALDEAVRVDNACLEGARRPGVTVAIHLCRGNNRSHWYAEGGYDAIAEKLFTSLQVDRFLLEYDDARSGTFEPLRFVPRGKAVVLGLVSSKLPALEPAAELRQRIESAARYVPLDSLALSPQCGFASTMEGNLLTEADQWAKLGLVTKVAREVWR